jgi:tetratricopeptide (TPR) repeat protein
MAEAETEYRTALDIDKRSLAPRHPHLAAVLANLGGVLRAQNKYVEARDSFSDALKALGNPSGPNGPHIANLHDSLGRVYELLGRLEEAEEHFSLAFDTDKATFHEGHPRLWIRLACLDRVKETAGRTGEEEARRLHSESIRSLRRNGDEDLVRVANPLLDVVSKQATEDKARSILREVVAKLRRVVTEREMSLSKAEDQQEQLEMNLGQCGILLDSSWESTDPLSWARAAELDGNLKKARFEVGKLRNTKESATLMLQDWHEAHAALVSTCTVRSPECGLCGDKCASLYFQAPARRSP